MRVHRPILYTADLVYRLTKAFTGAESYSVKGHNSRQMSPRSDRDMKGHQFKTLGRLLKVRTDEPSAKICHIIMYFNLAHKHILCVCVCVSLCVM